MASDPISAADIPFDARTWNFYFERVVANVVIDAVLEGVFQGKKDNLRDQMLDVAAKRTRRIQWTSMTGDIDPEQRDAVLKKAREIINYREDGDGDPLQRLRDRPASDG